MCKALWGFPTVVLMATAHAAAPAEARSDLVLSCFDTVAQWPGLARETVTVKHGSASAKWGAMDKTPGITCTALPHDWSRQNTLSFWIRDGVTVLRATRGAEPRAWARITKR